MVWASLFTPSFFSSKACPDMIYAEFIILQKRCHSIINIITLSYVYECWHDVVKMVSYNVLRQHCGNIFETFLEYVAVTKCANVFITFPQRCGNITATTELYIVSWVAGAVNRSIDVHAVALEYLTNICNLITSNMSQTFYPESQHRGICMCWITFRSEQILKSFITTYNTLISHLYQTYNTLITIYNTLIIITPLYHTNNTLITYL